MSIFKKSLLIFISAIILIFISLHYKSYLYNSKIEQLETAFTTKNATSLSSLFNNKYSKTQIKHLIKWAYEYPKEFEKQIALSTALAENYNSLFNFKKEPLNLTPFTIREEKPLFTLKRENLKYIFELNEQDSFLDTTNASSTDLPLKLKANNKLVELHPLGTNNDFYEFKLSPDLYKIEIYNVNDKLLDSKTMYIINGDTIYINEFLTSS